MPEDTKLTILRYLQQHKGDKFKVSEIYKKLKETRKISYGTVLKWVDVLVAEKQLNIEDWGNVKIVWFDNNGSLIRSENHG